MEKILKRTWAEIDLDALLFNFEQIKAVTSEKAEICCIIKADAYGHGAIRVAKELEMAGAKWFAVSNLEEALQLRNNGITSDMLVMGYTPANKAKVLADNNISQCVYSLEYAKELSAHALNNGANVNIHIKIDSGMSRLGFYFQDINRDDNAVSEVIEACSLPSLTPEGIFTHFAVSDSGTDGIQFTMRQFGCFKEMVEILTRNGIDFKYRHCANSAAVLDYSLIHMDMVRPGIILYGLFPSEAISNKPSLRPILSLKSVVSHVKFVEADSTMSYGRIFTAKKQMKIATVPIGYADGYARILGERGAQVLIHGKRCDIVGRICMDQLMVDASDITEVKSGDIVTLIGKDGSEEISADELARLQDTINYEIVCDIGKRVPRVYIKNGIVESVSNQLLPQH